MYRFLMVCLLTLIKNSLEYYWSPFMEEMVFYHLHIIHY